MGDVLEGTIVRPEMPDERRMAIDIAGRTDFFGDSADRHLFAI